MDFNKWITTQETREDLIGEFAREIKHSNLPQFPAGNSPKKLEDHLVYSGADYALIEYFHEAFNEFRNIQEEPVKS